MIEITLREYYQLLESWISNKDIGREDYLLIEKNRYFAIDNSTNEFFTEEFNSLTEAKRYLNANLRHRK